MRILFLGDVVGRSGREGLARHLPELKKRLNPDAVVVNAENATGGLGLTEKHAKAIFDLGIDCLTTGNHVWAQKDLVGVIDNHPRILRPLNFPDDTPGKASYLHALPDGRTLLVVCVMGRLFMNELTDDPFAATEKFLATRRLGKDASAILIDFHAEATAEKTAYAYVFDGRVSAVCGTHTHIPTSDERLLPEGTAYQTDVGMCGDYGGVIGAKKEASIWRFTRKDPGERLAPSEGEASVCGAFVVTDDKSGLAQSIQRVQVGGNLLEHWPQV